MTKITLTQKECLALSVAQQQIREGHNSLQQARRIMFEIDEARERKDEQPLNKQNNNELWDMIDKTHKIDKNLKYML